MKEYCVTITETLSRTINVVADSEEQAERIVRDRYFNQEIVLDADDFDDVEFETSISLMGI